MKLWSCGRHVMRTGKLPTLLPPTFDCKSSMQITVQWCGMTVRFQARNLAHPSWNLPIWLVFSQSEHDMTNQRRWWACIFIATLFRAVSVMLTSKQGRKEVMCSCVNLVWSGKLMVHSSMPLSTPVTDHAGYHGWLIILPDPIFRVALMCPDRGLNVYTKSNHLVSHDRQSYESKLSASWRTCLKYFICRAGGCI